MKQRDLTILLGMILLLSCTNHPQTVPETPAAAAIPDDSTIWQNYLHTVLHTSADTGKHTYVLACQYGCHGCLMHIVEEAKADKRNNITYIFPRHLSKYFEGSPIPANVLIDSSNKINKLKLHMGNISILRMDGNRILSNTLVDATNIEKTVIN